MDDTKNDGNEKKRNINKKREDYIGWEDYFMATAFLAAKRSKDPCSQVGACIVDKNNIILGVGYNGMPNGCSDDKLPWNKEGSSSLETKKFYVCHAEMNAILNKNCRDTKGCRMYVALFPCNECAKIIIQSGIEEVIYMSDKHASKPKTIAAKRMFDEAKVKYRPFLPKTKKIVIDFDEINRNQTSPNEKSETKSEEEDFRNMNRDRNRKT